MNDVVVKETKNEENKPLAIMMAILSAFASLVIGIYSFYLSSLGNYWFITVGIFFIADGGLLIAPLFIKDEYKAMRFQGIVQIISVIFFMSYLLFMVLWNDPDKKMDYSYMTFLLLGVGALFKVMLFVVNRMLIKEKYSPLVHAISNNSLICSLYLLLIIELIIVNLAYPGTSTAIFDNLFKEKPIWIYIIDILLNASLTVIAAFLALSTAIRAATKEQLSASNKIKHTIKWFNDNEVSMFFGLIFTFYLAVLSIINMKQSPFYVLLFIYYIGTVTIRLTNYLLHKRIQRICGDNQIRDNRMSSWLLLLDAITYLMFSNILVVASIFMMIQKANVGSNIYLFLFMIIPMGIMRWISANKSVKRNRKENNTYKLGVSLIGLVSVFFTLLEIVAIAMHNAPIVWLRYVVIILAIIVAKIAVIVVAIIFVIHWLRSIILNRRSKERKMMAEKEKTR